MKVSDWIRLHPQKAVTAPPEWTLGQIVERVLAEPGVRDIYVVGDDGRVLGHISHRRLARLFLAEHRPVHTLRQIFERVAGGVADELMDTHFVSAHPDEELDNILHRQLEHDVEDMPVLDADGVVLGVVRLREVLRAFRARGGEVIPPDGPV